MALTTSKVSTKRKALLFTLATATVATAVAASPATASATAGPGTPKAGTTGSATPGLDWHDCQTGLDGTAGSTPNGTPDGTECATLAVPLDYGKPSGRTVDIAVSRIRSDKPTARRGTLLVIPGGPGSSGVDRLAKKGQALRKETGGAYDLVSFDPRGVGDSTRADCKLEADDLEPAHLRSWPGADGDIGGSVARSRRIAEACARNGGEVMRSLTTANEVRDIESLRLALGEEKLSAWANSYGTYVGAVYAQKYPEHTDRWVLDSSGDPDPGRVARGWLANMSAAADDRFPDFARWAAAPERDAKHRVAGRAEDVRPLFLSLAKRLDGVPERSADGKGQLTGNRLRMAMQQALYSDAAFEQFAALVVTARDAGDKPVPYDLPSVSSADATVNMAVVCNDVRWPRSVPEYARDVRTDRIRHPLTAGMPVSVTPCAFWKDRPADKPTRITSDGPSNILMVQSLRDPATPYRGALKMREAFGERARLVGVDAGGHGVYLGNATRAGEDDKRAGACADRAVTTFLTTGQRPASDTLCTTAGTESR
ncbi:alpha/beta hydrolase [Streptomyces roseifaciens]|uniref:alpha/beta hydrolase n=1 Tax=Streptomyces roseifaciens TaxID=1488406 RepID=UPI000717FEF1|nr:alpha/beta hydrolase [Streptomyces roseifaciens]